MNKIKSITLLIGTFVLLATLNLGAAEENVNFDDEVYINDIPFRTECISVECLYEKAIAENYEFEEEAFIEDIPFNTECITEHCQYQKALNQVFDFEDESYIDDIPFDTQANVIKTGRASFGSGK